MQYERNMLCLLWSLQFDLFMKEINGNSQVNGSSPMLRGSVSTAETFSKESIPTPLTLCPLPNSFHFQVLLPKELKAFRKRSCPLSSKMQGAPQREVDGQQPLAVELLPVCSQAWKWLSLQPRLVGGKVFDLRSEESQERLLVDWRVKQGLGWQQPESKS